MGLTKAQEDVVERMNECEGFPIQQLIHNEKAWIPSGGGKFERTVYQSTLRILLEKEIIILKHESREAGMRLYELKSPTPLI